METIPENRTGYSIDALQSMELPEIPQEINCYLRINWIREDGLPAASAMEAMTDQSGEPLVMFSYLFRTAIVEEEIPYKDIEREAKIYTEMALEDLCYI